MRRVPLLAVALLVLLAAGPALPGPRPVAPATSGPVTADPTTPCVVGRQADGAVVLPTNQVVTPAGRQVEFPGRPNAVAIHPNGRTAAFLTAFGPAPLVVVDLDRAEVLQRFDPDGAAEKEGASFTGVLYAPDGRRLFASDAKGAITVAAVAEDGRLRSLDRIALPAPRGTPRPGGLALGGDGRTLYVALNRHNTLGVVDLAAGRLVDEIPVGNAPHDVVLVGGKAYVSNEGGRRARPGDHTENSGGTEIVADPRTGAATTGSVSVIDLRAAREIAQVPVDLRPTALLAHGEDLFVANTSSDTVSVIDTVTDEVVKTVAVQPFPHAPWGSSPTALAMVADSRLVVGLSGNNALAVYDWAGPAEPVGFRGLVPTAWHPAGLALNPTTAALVVANAKGVGSLGAEATRSNGTGKWSHMHLGSASLIPVRDLDDAEGATATVYRNNQWSTSRCSHLERGGAGGTEAAAPAPVPLRLGDPTPIKHVFYVIKENRTYDQVLGDLPRGNGDPSLAEFGAEVTPNQHALAEEFQILDNLYVSGTGSSDGHQWVTQAYVSDYVERAFGDFSRANPSVAVGGDALAYAPTGFLWDQARRHGRTVRVYGEYANRFARPGTGGDGPYREGLGAWPEWYRDALVLRGERSGPLHVPVGEFQTGSTVPSLDAVLDREFPPYTELIPDIYRAELFIQDLERYEAEGGLPDLTMMPLTSDHTAGTAPGFPTPRAMVADNDLALGRIVEAITHSRFWPESAIFVVEDDAQGGVDHVSGHRTVGWVISPYARRGIVDSAYYTQIDMIRTIEQILGLPPMNQMDLAATPMRGLFTDEPDLTPFRSRPNRVPLDEMNPDAAALDGVARAWAETSAAMGFAAAGEAAEGPDSEDERVLNRAIWYAGSGFERPYPGDERVLWPHEVVAPREPVPAGDPTLGSSRRIRAHSDTPPSHRAPVLGLMRGMERRVEQA